MKAAVYERYGPPGVVEVKEVETPSIRDDALGMIRRLLKQRTNGCAVHTSPPRAALGDCPRSHRKLRHLNAQHREHHYARELDGNTIASKLYILRRRIP